MPKAPIPGITPHEPTPTPAERDMAKSELPVLESIGMHRTAKGWIVYRVVTQGQRVIDQEILSEPEAKLYAVERLKIENARRFMLPSRMV